MSDLVILRDEIEECPECTMDGFDLCREHSNQLPRVGKGWVEEIKEAIHTTDRRVSTAKDLAKDLGVTSQTIQNHLQEVLQESPGYQRGPVTTASIFPYFYTLCSAYSSTCTPTRKH